MADEERLAVVVGVDEPATRSSSGAVGPDRRRSSGRRRRGRGSRPGAGRRRAVRISTSGWPKTVNRLPVPVFLSWSPSSEIGVHPRVHDGQAPDRAHLLRPRVEREAAHDQQVGPIGRLLGRLAHQLLADGAVLGTDRDRDPPVAPPSWYLPSAWRQRPGNASSVSN